MIPAHWNITIVQGDTFSMELRFKSSDGTYIDLTGATVKSQIRSRSGGTVLVALSAALMDQVATKGGVILSLTPTQTAALLSNGVYDVEVDWPGGTVQTYLEGGALMQQDVTRVP